MGTFPGRVIHDTPIELDQLGKLRSEAQACVELGLPAAVISWTDQDTVGSNQGSNGSTVTIHCKSLETH